MRYTVNQRWRDQFSIIELRDTGSDSIAEIVPGIGNNLYRFQSKGQQVLVPPVSLTSLKNDLFASFKYGTPILFPPNRVKNGSINYKGRGYNLPLNEPPNHHLHGELCTRGWEVIESGASDEQGAFVTSRFRYTSYPEIMAYFPHPLTFTITIRLYEGQLEMNGAIVNEGEDEAPFAFGLHPYFSLPFGEGEEIVLHVPAVEEWPVTNEAFVTGLPAVTDFSRKLNEGISIADYPELGCSLMSVTGGGSICRIEMKDRGYSIGYRFGPEFPYVVLFRPDWASAYSLEPYTYVTDAFNLPYEYEMTGAKGIGPGEELCFSTGMWIE